VQEQKLTSKTLLKTQGKAADICGCFFVMYEKKRTGMLCLMMKLVNCEQAKNSTFFLNTMRDIVFQRQTMAKWLNLEILA